MPLFQPLLWTQFHSRQLAHIQTNISTTIKITLHEQQYHCSSKSFSPYISTLSHKTPNPSVLHPSLAISLKYPTHNTHVRTQPQSLRVDASTSLLLYAKIMPSSTCENNLSLCSPESPPYGVEEEEEDSVSVVTDSRRQLPLTSTSDDIEV